MGRPSPINSAGGRGKKRKIFDQDGRKIKRQNDIRHHLPDPPTFSLVHKLMNYIDTKAKCRL
jgi:hypothetical protein